MRAAGQRLRTNLLRALFGRYSGADQDALAIAYLVADASSAVSSSGWSAPVKVFANGVIGGTASELQGGSFQQGFIYSAASSGASELYKGIVGYEINPKSGGDSVTKTDVQPPVKGANNIGFQGYQVVDGLPIERVRMLPCILI